MSPEMYQKMKFLYEKPLPELPDNLKNIDYFKSDIYSLGLTILQMINMLDIADIVGINCDEYYIKLD